MSAGRLPSILPCLAIAIVATACQSPSTPPPSGKSAALETMERIATNAYNCWFATKDPQFRQYRMANELNSFSGRPRFLLVPAQAPESRPLLVVQAEGTRPDLQAFGPLMDGALGDRIAADIRRWNAGSAACTAAA